MPWYNPVRIKPWYNPVRIKSWYNPVRIKPWYNPVRIKPWYNPVRIKPWYNPVRIKPWYNPVRIKSWYNPVRIKPWYNPVRIKSWYNPVRIKPWYNLVRIKPWAWVCPVLLGLQVIEVGKFWGYRADEASMRLTMDIKGCKLLPITISLSPNLLCLAPYLENQECLYYRAIIQHVRGSTVEVRAACTSKEAQTNL